MFFFKGLGVVLIILFKDEESVDFEIFGRFVDFYFEYKIDVIIVCGIIGEFLIMLDDEYLEVIRFVIDRVVGRKFVIVGVGSNYIKYVVYFFKKVQEFGVDGFLYVILYYNKII